MCWNRAVADLHWSIQYWGLARGIKYTLESVLVASALVLGASVDHGRDPSSMLEHYLPFGPIGTARTPYAAALCDAVSCLDSHLHLPSLKTGVLFLCVSFSLVRKTSACYGC